MHLGHHLIDHDRTWHHLERRRQGTTEARTGADRPALWSHLFVLMAGSRGISNFGNALASVGLGYLVITVTGSSMWVALVATGYAVMYALGGVINSMVGDRTDPRTMLWIGQGIEISADVFIIVLIATDSLSGPTLFIAALLGGLLGAFEFPAWQVLLRVVIPSDRLGEGVAANNSIKSAGMLLGSLAASAFLHFEALTALFVIDIISYAPVLWTLVALRDLELPQRGVDHDAEDAPAERTSPLDSLRFAWRDHTTRWTLIVLATLSFLIGPLTQMIPAAVTWIPMDASWLGLLAAALYLGQAGQAFIVDLSSRKLTTGLLISVAGAVCAAILFAIGASQHPVVFTVGLVAFGASLGAAQSELLAVIDGTVPERLIGRVVSIYVVTFAAFGGLGLLFWGFVTNEETFGLVTVGCGLAGAAFVLWVVLTRRVRLLDGATPTDAS
jgi:hypothetical protein